MEKNSKKVIGFVSMDNPFLDKVAWSGTLYKLRESIEMAGFEVKWIPYNTHFKSKLLYYSIYNFTKNWNSHFTKYKWLPGHHFRPSVKAWAKEVDANLELKECDYLFYPLAAKIAIYTKNIKPYINLSDYTVPDMLDYYFHNITKKSKTMAIEMDAVAAQNAFINIRSSQWANDGLLNYYHCAPNKCHILEFGPNIDTKDIRQGQTYEGGQLRLLFSGKDWKRKGGDIAVETVEILRSKGIDARLIVAGPYVCPESCKGKDYIDYIGYLNKNNADDYDKYLSLYEHSHMLLLPTKAECSAIVYSEAAATGIPCYTYLTGGVGNYIVNEVNGYALPEGSPASAFAEQILKDIRTGRIPSLHEGALNLFKEKLSWEAWARGFKKIMEEASA